ncbi:hypothetical protein MVEN_00073800 [Mycena venus]|uniref:Uncharacterized protein n=1 Tax=Mycena venus TaxID=2733690 RepID=A0A8H7DH84_9AGAR|nr:hypothetical protein MVEN_00073800 [Mycena venus]
MLLDLALFASSRKRKNSITTSLEEPLHRQRIRSESHIPNEQPVPYQMTDEDQPMNNRNTNSNSPTPRAAPQIVSEVNGVTTLDNGQQYTTPPAGGFPILQMAESVWRNTTEASQVTLHAEKDPKIWTRVYRGSARDDLQAVAAKIVAAARRLTGDDCIDIIAPIEKAPLDERYPAPYHYLLVDGDEAAMSFLTATPLWATPDVQFIGTLEGFACQDSPDSNTAIAMAVSRQLMALQHIVEYLVQHARPRPGQSAADLATKVLNSVTIYSFENGPQQNDFLYCLELTCPLISEWDGAPWCVTLRLKSTALDVDGSTQEMYSLNAPGASQTIILLACARSRPSQAGLESPLPTWLPTIKPFPTSTMDITPRHQLLLRRRPKVVAAAITAVTKMEEWDAAGPEVDALISTWLLTRTYLHIQSYIEL